MPPDIPPELLDAAKGGAGGATGAPPSAGAGAMPSPGGGGSAPAGGPMSTPNPKAGLEQAARVNVEMTVKLLEQSMGAFPMDSDEKKSLMSAHSALVKGFGASKEKAGELIPAELMQLMQGMPGAGGAPGPKPPGGMPPGQPAMPAPSA